jgi:hypothetical protein
MKTWFVELSRGATRKADAKADPGSRPLFTELPKGLDCPYFHARKKPQRYRYSFFSALVPEGRHTDLHLYGKAVIRQLSRLSEKRRSFKRGLWGSCVATLMPHKGVLLSRRDAAPPAYSISTSRKIDFERTIRRTKKPPARGGGFVQFANKVLIALP